MNHTHIPPTHTHARNYPRATEHVLNKSENLTEIEQEAK